MNPLEWAILIALATVWGGSFFFNVVAVRELPVFTIVVVRVTLAAVILLLILKLTGEAIPHHIMDSSSRLQLGRSSDLACAGRNRPPVRQG